MSRVYLDGLREKLASTLDPSHLPPSCVHIRIGDGKILKITPHLDLLASLQKGDYIIHMKPEAILTEEEFRSTHPNDPDDWKTASWAEDAVEDHSNIINAIRDMHGEELSNVALRILDHPVYSGGEKAEGYDDSLGSAALEADNPFIALRPEKLFRDIYANRWGGSEDKVDSMRRRIQAHELLHFVEQALGDTKRKELLDRINSEGFSTRYTDTLGDPHTKNKELIVEFLAKQLLERMET